MSSQYSLKSYSSLSVCLFSCDSKRWYLLSLNFSCSPLPVGHMQLILRVPLPRLRALTTSQQTFKIKPIAVEFWASKEKVARPRGKGRDNQFKRSNLVASNCRQRDGQFSCSDSLSDSCLSCLLFLFLCLALQSCCATIESGARGQVQQQQQQQGATTC